MIRSIAIFLLLVGLLWGFFVSALLALAGGFFGNAPPSDPVLIGKGFLSVWWLFAGPLLLTGGAICILRGTYLRAGAISALVGCFILTAMVGYQTVQMLHDAADPLITTPSYVEYAIAVILTFLSDAGAVRLYQTASPGAENQEAGGSTARTSPARSLHPNLVRRCAGKPHAPYQFRSV